MSVRSHASGFAVHLIGKHEARTTGMIFVAFTQLGNTLPGDDMEAQKDALREMLSADDRLAYDPKTDSWTDKSENDDPNRD